jgi:hypothetical protein
VHLADTARRHAELGGSILAAPLVHVASEQHVAQARGEVPQAPRHPGDRFRSRTLAQYRLMRLIVGLSMI